MSVRHVCIKILGPLWHSAILLTSKDHCLDSSCLLKLWKHKFQQLSQPLWKVKDILLKVGQRSNRLQLYKVEAQTKHTAQYRCYLHRGNLMNNLKEKTRKISIYTIQQYEKCGIISTPMNYAYRCLRQPVYRFSLLRDHQS